MLAAELVDARLVGFRRELDQEVAGVYLENARQALPGSAECAPEERDGAI